MRGKHIVFGPDGSVVHEEEVENWEATWATFPRPARTTKNPSVVAREMVELVRAATSLDDLKRALLLYLGELRLDREGRIQGPEV
jgi:hypothetical protein